MKSVWLILIAVFSTACVTTGDGPVRESSPKQAALTNLKLGSEYLQRGDKERALEKLNRAVAQDPDLALAQAYLGLTYEQLGQDPEAEKHYRLAVKLSDDDASVRNMYAVYLCRRDRIEEAEKHFLAAVAIKTYSTPETAYTNAGICRLKVSDFEQAEVYLRKALELNSRYADALWHMARLTHDNDRDFQSRAFLQRLGEVATMSAEVLWLGFTVETNLGDERAAERYASELMSKYPESSEAAQLHTARRNDPGI